MSKKPDIDSVQMRLSEQIRSFPVCITYIPLPDEVSWNRYVRSIDTERTYTIAPQATSDPLRVARDAVAFASSERACVLLPGKAFDAHGTRFGRGGGWYDRFLSHTPIHWYRIGFCFDQQFSDAPLPRQSWDEAVDMVCVIDSTNNHMRIVHADKPRIT